jgi:hypothetical protein
MLRTFQFRLLPNAAQRPALEHVLADSSETYNAALRERRDTWRLERNSITYRVQQDELTELRMDERFAVIACDIQRDPLRRVDRACKTFFRRVGGSGEATLHHHSLFAWWRGCTEDAGSAAARLSALRAVAGPRPQCGVEHFGARDGRCGHQPSKSTQGSS